MKKKALPGVMVFDQRKQLLYISDEAKKALEGEDSTRLQDETSTLLDSITSQDEGSPSLNPGSVAASDKGFYLRAVPLYGTEKKRKPSHFMVIIETHGQGVSQGAEDLIGRFNLTRREAQIAGEVAKGLTNQEISVALSISEHTVKDHIKKIMSKLQVKNRSMIISRIFE